MPRRYTPTQVGQIAALTRWSKENGAAQAARGQSGLLARFEREADPNNELPAAERQRRAQNLRKLHMLRMATKSAEVRAAKKAAAGADAQDAESSDEASG